MKQNKKIIGVDARFYGPLGKGLGRYIKEVLDRVLILDTEHDYVVFLAPENFDEFSSSAKNVKKVLVSARWYSWQEQIAMPYYIWRERVDLMHFPHFNVPLFCPAKFIVTIHDLILTKFPTPRASKLHPLFYAIKNLAYRIIISAAVRRSQSIIAVSEFTKNDLITQLKVAPEKIVVTYEGVAASIGKDNDKMANAVNDKNIILGYNIKTPYLLYVGNVYPHKNLEGLLNIFSKIRLKNPEINLVLVGKEDYFYQRVKKQAQDLGFYRQADVNRDVVFFPDHVSDQDLKVFYHQARGYVFPSFYEGFGLPPLEAMAAGCPVVSSSEASMPEILGTAAIYFNPHNEIEMINQIGRLIADEVLRAELKVSGYKQAQKYSWDVCAERTLELYLKYV